MEQLSLPKVNVAKGTGRTNMETSLKSPKSHAGAGISKYSGVAGQFAVMTELALRGYNVAAPGVDIGDDVLVLNENTGKIDRIQVKTSRPNNKASTNGRYIYEFQILKSRITSILQKAGAETFFVFAMLTNGFPKCWTYVVMSRSVLADKVEQYELGEKTNLRGQIRLSIAIEPDGILYFFKRNLKVPLNSYRNNWNFWPPIPPYDT